MSSTTPVSSWYQLRYSWGSASLLWKKKPNWKRLQKYLWIIPPEINTMKCQLNHRLRVNPLQQSCTSQAYEKKKKKRNTIMWPVQSYTRAGTDGRWENKRLLSTTVIILLPCTSTPWGHVRLHVSDPDHRLSPEPSASQRAEGQRELRFPKANHGITAMVTSAEKQKLCHFNWFKSVPLRSHWNFTYTFQLVALDNTY